MNKIQLKIHKLHPDVKLPVYSTPGAACFDLFSREVVDADMSRSDLRSGATETHATGLTFEVPEGHVMLIFSRSGHGFNKNIRLANCVGVIDSDYRGEVKVKLICDDINKGYVDVREGERIAQAMLVPIPQVEFVLTEALTETSRGVGGFGSTNYHPDNNPD